MSDIIKLLPDSVANQIAAGEVIQRPASVIKELVENSVDAGATDIRIIIKDAGRTLIQVIDNGIGMSPTDARMAFERHATSKIKSASDLFNLSTMGFRGEALPSICAVSQIDIKTRTKEANIGTHISINATKVESQEPAVCESGTNLSVKNLFFNVPARRKFLKSDSVELSNILREFERLALVNNHIHLSLDYGSKVIDLRQASFKQRISDIWKNSIETHLIPLEVNTSIIKISGFICRPECARRRNPLQYLIVNGRNMRHSYFHKAIASCYESLIAPDTQPCYFLKFEVDPGSIDVNIHPTKNEIKFEYEQQIWPIINAAVKAALGHFGAGPAIDFSQEIIPIKKFGKGEFPEQPRLNLNKDYSPLNVVGSGFNNGIKTAEKDFDRKFRHKDWEKLYSDFMNASRGFSPEQDENEISEKSVLPEFEKISNLETLCLQHSQQYIVTSSGSRIFIIDQRRAHLRVLYEEFFRHIIEGEVVSQRIMFPEILTLDNPETEILKSIKNDLLKIGFQFENDGENRIKLIAVPAILKKIDYGDLIKGIIDTFMEDSVNYGKIGDLNEAMMKKIALVMARKSAITKETKLTEDEMEHIVCDLFSLPDPAMTPDGSKIYMVIDNDRLGSFFRNN